MLIGEYEAKVTDKNRIAIPKKIRIELNKTIYITRGYEGCLILLDNSSWLKFENLIKKRTMLSVSARDTKRFIYGGAYEIVLDEQGRFVLPDNLIMYAGINKEIVFIGIGDWVEIWDKYKWNERLASIIGQAGDIAEEVIKTSGNKAKHDE